MENNAHHSMMAKLVQLSVHPTRHPSLEGQVPILRTLSYEWYSCQPVLVFLPWPLCQLRRHGSYAGPLLIGKKEETYQLKPSTLL
jgi:hypothetical protein